MPPPDSPCWRGLVCVVVLLAAAAARADKPPIAGRPADFSGAVGTFSISVTAEPTELPPGERITLTVRITADGPFESGPKRPDLNKVPAITDDFDVEPLPEAASSGPVWEFVYRLRPKNDKVDLVPRLHLKYYQPNKTAGFRGSFPTASSDSIPIVIREKVAVTTESPPVKPPPESTYLLAEGTGVLSRPLSVPLPESVQIALVLALPPTICLFWYLVWWRLYPDAAKLTQQRRSRAARVAINRLHAARRLPRPRQAERAGAVLAGYFRQRLDLSAAEPTPDEVAAVLFRAGCPAAVVDKTARFFQERDQACYAGGDDSRGWAGDAEVLVAEVETALDAVVKKEPVTSDGPLSLVGVLLLALLIAAGSAGCRDTPDEDRGLVATAQEQFNAGLSQRDKPSESQPHFRAAAATYDELKQRGWDSPALRRNLGNAYLLSGDLPRAILTYRQGVEQFPYDAALRDQLESARAMVEYSANDKLGSPGDDHPSLWAMLLPPWLVLSVAVVLYSLAWAAATRWLMVRKLSWLFAVPVCLVFAGLLGWLWWSLESHREALASRPVVVIADDAVLIKKGNGHNYPRRYPTTVNRGVEARLLAERGEWVKVQFAGGETGWVFREYVVY